MQSLRFRLRLCSLVPDGGDDGAGAGSFHMETGMVIAEGRGFSDGVGVTEFHMRAGKRRRVGGVEVMAGRWLMLDQVPHIISFLGNIKAVSLRN